MRIRVERMIGPKPVSSSRTMTLATKAVETNMKKIVMTMTISPMALGAFLWTLPPEPMLHPVDADRAEHQGEEDQAGDPEDRLAQLVAQFEGGDLAEHRAGLAQAARREAERVEK